MPTDGLCGRGQLIDHTGLSFFPHIKCGRIDWIIFKVMSNTILFLSDSNIQLMDFFFQVCETCRGRDKNHHPYKARTEFIKLSSYAPLNMMIRTEALSK